MPILVTLIPLFPLAGFLLLALAGARLPRRVVAFVGPGSVALSTLAAFGSTALLVSSPDAGGSVTLWTLLHSGSLTVQIGLDLDPLAAVMACVVTFVSLLVHIYATSYMRDDPGCARFFAWLNLFVAAMLLLVLADNLLLLYVGWEGVGLCSYLLIGFWYQERANSAAAMKAFIVTRIGDAAMAVGLLLLATQLGTLNISEVLARAADAWPVGSPLATAAAALLLAGAIGKSAQVPLHVWLPDAMAGPTPVSALIHAATMVTAGAYLLARTHALFALAPAVTLAVAIVGAASILVGAVCALGQRDLKRILAYSTMSQVGYMFLALGVGSWTGAMFHFATHAFFKSLLFLGAGALIHAAHDERDIFAMRGVRRAAPLPLLLFVVGACALAGLPLVTSGFYSKEMILGAVLERPGTGPYLWVAGALGVVLTSLYAFRAVFVLARDPSEPEQAHRPAPAIALPMVVLAVLAFVSGVLGTPYVLGNSRIMEHFLEPAAHAASASHPVWPLIVASLLSIVGIGAAWLIYIRFAEAAERLSANVAIRATIEFCHDGLRFDALYHAMIVEPFTYLAQANASNLIDGAYRLLAAATESAHRLLSRGQSGQLRWYVVLLAVGAAILAYGAVLR